MGRLMHAATIRETPVPDPFVLMHISDLHVHRLPRNPLVYASKRMLGAANLVLRRRHRFPAARARALVALLEAQAWDHLLITGDLTQLGTLPEFELARSLLAPLLAGGPEQATVLPGNHDRYVVEPVGAGAFETVFPEWRLEGGFHTRQLTERWHLALWDSAQPAPWLSAAGRVPSEVLKATGDWMASLPPGTRIIIANHYPVFFPAPHRYVAGHDLINQIAVRQWLCDHPPALYLHGHIHHNWVHREDTPGGAITSVNSASSTQRPAHHTRDSLSGQASAFHRIVLSGGDFRIEPQGF